MGKFCIILLSFLFIVSCKTDTTESTSKSASPANAANVSAESKYYSEVEQFITANRGDKTALISKLKPASETALKNKHLSKASGYLLSLLRLENNVNERKDYLGQLATTLNSMDKTHAATVLAKAYKKTHGDLGEFDSLNSLLSDGVELDKHMNSAMEAMFVEPDEYGLNKVNAQKFVDMAEAYALGVPQSPMAPTHLYKAAETARSIRTIPKALNIYDWMMEDYPDYEKTPTVMFLKGFVIENELQNDDEAGKIYKEFLAKYPKHEMSQSVQFLLENLGKSDEEILDLIEKK